MDWLVFSFEVGDEVDLNLLDGSLILETGDSSVKGPLTNFFLILLGCAFGCSDLTFGSLDGDSKEPDEVLLLPSALLLLSNGSEGNDPILDIVPIDSVVMLSPTLDIEEQGKRSRGASDIEIYKIMSL